MNSRFRLLLGLPALFAVGIAGIRMYQLSQAEQLWGWWPLAFLLGGWALIVALRQNLSRLGYLGTATLAGVCLGLGFPPFPTWPLMAVGFVLLLKLTDDLVAEGESLTRQWWYSYHALVLFNVLASWWVANTALAAGIVANFLNAFFMAVPWALLFLVRKHMPKVWLAAAPMLWIGFEYVHYHWEIAWPWMTFGNGLASTPSLVQWYAYTGVFGGSFYLAGGASLCYYLWDRVRNQQTSQRAAMLSGMAWWSIPVGLSVIQLTSLEVPAPTHEVLAVQPNLEPHYEKFSGQEAAQLDHFFQLLGSSSPNQLVILPETSFGSYDEARLNSTPLLQRWNASGQQGDLLAGLSTYKRYASAIDDPALRTRMVGDGRTLYYTSHNSAVSAVDQHLVDVYHKSRLVPGVESLPYRKLFFFFEPLVKRLGGTTAGLGVSDSARVFRYPSGIRAAPLICYESIYGEYVAEFVRAGANLLVVPTNDGWWDETPGHIQHLQFGQLRAIEHRRWLVQAANSGISALVDPAGRIVTKLPYNQEGALVGRVGLQEKLTFFSLRGDMVGRTCCGLAALLVLSLLSVMLRRRD